MTSRRTWGGRDDVDHVDLVACGEIGDVGEAQLNPMLVADVFQSLAAALRVAGGHPLGAGLQARVGLEVRFRESAAAQDAYSIHSLRLLKWQWSLDSASKRLESSWYQLSRTYYDFITSKGVDVDGQGLTCRNHYSNISLVPFPCIRVGDLAERVEKRHQKYEENVMTRLILALFALVAASLVAAACTEEVVREVPVEVIVEKEVVREVPVEKIVTQEVVKEVHGTRRDRRRGERGGQGGHGTRRDGGGDPGGCERGTG